MERKKRGKLIFLLLDCSLSISSSQQLCLPSSQHQVEDYGHGKGWPPASHKSPFSIKTGPDSLILVQTVPVWSKQSYYKWPCFGPNGPITNGPILIQTVLLQMALVWSKRSYSKSPSFGPNSPIPKALFWSKWSYFGPNGPIPNGPLLVQMALFWSKQSFSKWPYLGPNGPIFTDGITFLR